MSIGRKPSGPQKAAQTKNQGKAILTLADQVIALRTEAGLTQQELSSQAGLGPHGIHRIEKAQVDPKLSVIETVATILGTTPSDLLKR